MFKLRPEGHEGIRHVGIWGRAFPAPGTASAKPLVWEGGMREGERASRVHGVGWVRERQARDDAEVWQEPARTGPGRLPARLGSYSEQDGMVQGRGI